MSRPKGAGRGFLGLLVLVVLIVLIALPTFAAEPSASPSASADPTATTTTTAAPTATAAPRATAAPAATTDPEAAEEAVESAKPEKSPRAPKAEKGPEVDVTITGTVATRTDADGNNEYTTIAGGKTLVLDAGPAWFYGANHPLKPFVGKRVTITGEQRVGEGEVDVKAINGTRLRAEGKPPWAGGWKRVGERHPGWTQEKWDRWQTKFAAKAKGLRGDCFPPGQCKDKPGKRAAASDDMTGADAGG